MLPPLSTKWRREWQENQYKLLTTQALELKQQLSARTTWMKYKLICFSINRLLNHEKNKIVSRHKKDLASLIDPKQTSDGITENHNEIFTRRQFQKIYKETNPEEIHLEQLLDIQEKLLNIK